jgi:internalin A
MLRAVVCILMLIAFGFPVPSNAQQAQLPQNARIGRDQRGNILYLDLSGKSDFDKAKITPETLKAISSLKTLESLDLSFSNVSDDALPVFKNLKSLKSLELAYTSVTGKAIEQLSTMPGLLSLRLEACDVQDAHLTALARMPKLAQLYLGRTRVTDAGLPAIGKLSELVLLDLTDCKITDAGLLSLGRLKHIRNLWLSKTIRHGEDDRSALTDESIRYLSTLKTLRELRIADSKMSPEGLQRLRGALPKTTINVERTGITYLSRSEP